MSDHEVHVKFAGKIVFVGFGSIGQGVLPLILRHIGTSADRITIVTAEDAGRAEAEHFGVKFVKTALTRDNYRQMLQPLLGAGDFLAEPVGRRVERRAHPAGARARRAVSRYLHRTVGGRLHRSEGSPVETRSNYVMRLEALALRDVGQGTRRLPCSRTAPIPGLVSHLVKQALLNIAKDTGVEAGTPASRDAMGRSWRRRWVSRSFTSPSGTRRSPNVPKKMNEFVNTWSVDGFVSEGAQPAELGWGTHEKHFPADGGRHKAGSGCAIYLNRPGASTSRAHLDAQGGILSMVF